MKRPTRGRRLIALVALVVLMGVIAAFLGRALVGPLPGDSGDRWAVRDGDTGQAAGGPASNRPDSDGLGHSAVTVTGAEVSGGPPALTGEAGRALNAVPSAHPILGAVGPPPAAPDGGPPTLLLAQEAGLGGDQGKGGWGGGGAHGWWSIGGGWSMGGGGGGGRGPGGSAGAGTSGGSASGGSGSSPGSGGASGSGGSSDSDGPLQRQDQDSEDQDYQEQEGSDGDPPAPLLSLLSLPPDNPFGDDLGKTTEQDEGDPWGSVADGAVPVPAPPALFLLILALAVAARRRPIRP